MDSSESVVLYSVDEGVASITLNRPERLNASNGDMSRGLTAAFTRAGADPAAKVILLTGAGRAFCAGADTQVLNEIAANPGQPNSGSGGLRYDGLMRLPKPVIAAINGPCAGIGLALACSADIRIASELAVFVAPFARLGLCAEGGLAWLLSRLIGPSNAAEMLMSARRVGADEAYTKGLVSHVWSAAEFAESAKAYARSLAANAGSSLAMMKLQLAEADLEDFETARAKSFSLTRETFGSVDFNEAMAAAREKRPPRFSPVVAKFEPPVSQG